MFLDETIEVEMQWYSSTQMCKFDAHIHIVDSHRFSDEKLPELVVLVDFKAIHPGVPPGIFASFPGVAHFLSFEQICQYPG
jgi:hypothetical protein